MKGPNVPDTLLGRDGQAARAVYIFFAKLCCSFHPGDWSLLNTNVFVTRKNHMTMLWLVDQKVYIPKLYEEDIHQSTTKQITENS